MNTVERIGTGDVVLRRATLADVDARFALGNDPEILAMFGVGRDSIAPVTHESAARWVQSCIDHPHAWIIEFRDRLVGVVRLDRVDMQDRRASMAIGIYDAALLGRGVGSQAISLVLGFAFGELALHRISVRVLAHNARAIRAYTKCGFTVEGREREAAHMDGAWHDDVMMGILDREFAAR
jgi:RimJ/RimL family protein N-acetyltransferase